MYGGVPWVLWCWFPDSRRHTSSQNQRKAKESKQDYTREIKMYLRSEQNKQLIRSITESGLSLPAIETHTQNVKSIPLNVKIWKLDGTEALLRTRLEVKTGWKRGRRQVKTGRQKYEPRQTGSRLWYSNYLLDEMEKKYVIGYLFSISLFGVKKMCHDAGSTIATDRSRHSECTRTDFFLHLLSYFLLNVLVLVHGKYNQADTLKF